MNNFLKIKRALEREADPAFARRAKIIFENLEIKGNEKVLDLGCGRGFYLKTLSLGWPVLQLYGLDLNKQYLKAAKKNLQKTSVRLIEGNATRLPFKNNFFERIIASEILEHIKNDQKAIREIYRVLKPNGIVLITVPNKNYPFFWDPLNWLLTKLFHAHIPSHIWWLAGIWADHQRLYDQEELVLKLKRSNFKIKKIWRTTHYCFPFSHFLLYGIGKNLVERGILKDFNRFCFPIKQSVINKLLLWPIRKLDQGNDNKNDFHSSVNLIVKIEK